MVELKDIGIGALSASLLIILGIAVLPDATHICRDLEITKYCHHLSGTGKTCYPLPESRTGSKYCSSGWEEFDNLQPPAPVPQDVSNSKEWECFPGICVAK